MLLKKNQILLVCLLAIVGFNLTSCKTAAPFIVDENECRLRTLTEPLSEGNFVILKDSSRLYSKSISEKHKLFKAPVLVLDSGRKIKLDDVIGVKSDNITFYARFVSPSGTSKKNKTSDDKYYGGFSNLINNGRINLYRKFVEEVTYRQEGARTNVVRRKTLTFYYLQKDNGLLTLATDKSLYEMVSDHAESVEIMDEYFKRKKVYRRNALINSIVGIPAVSLAVYSFSKKDGNKTMGKISAGIAIGSAIYDYINTYKARKNNKQNLNLAYQTYNYAYMKKVK